ncbi:hypothetical protein I3760_04G178500 [Carya illinoinensis]|nr:hypothetical protein I3760_04G178500 [Carya illinoinensis]
MEKALSPSFSLSLSLVLLPLPAECLFLRKLPSSRVDLVKVFLSMSHDRQRYTSPKCYLEDLSILRF